VADDAVLANDYKEGGGECWEGGASGVLVHPQLRRWVLSSHPSIKKSSSCDDDLGRSGTLPTRLYLGSVALVRNVFSAGLRFHKFANDLVTGAHLLFHFDFFGGTLVFMAGHRQTHF